MMQVMASEDCGNSPKNIFVQDLAIAFAKRDLGFLLSSVSDDVVWHILGKRRMEGKAELAAEVRRSECGEVRVLAVHHVVTHGKAGAVNGTRTFEDGTTEEFCDVYEFTNAKGTVVRAISSYVIEGQ